MARNFARRHQNRIESNIANRVVWICCEPNFSGGRDAPALPAVDRFGSFIETGTRLHLGEHEELTPARNNIDFAEWASPSSRQNTESLRDQEGGSAAFGRNTDPKRRLTFWARGTFRAMRGSINLRHRRYSE